MVTLKKTAGATSGTLYRPFTAPVTVNRPCEYNIDADEVIVLALDGAK